MGRVACNADAGVGSVRVRTDSAERHTHPRPDVRRVSRLFLPHDTGDDFIVELLSESLQTDPRDPMKKRMLWLHDKTIGPNDYGDALKMQFIIWQIIGPALQESHKTTPAPTKPLSS